ncbi:MAG: hypothetical protein K1Y02_13670 [Candidatus Hydrogenedentes bacterium]|nr:hypothetical protein [Candidatus Hydrogenedentota bacterium]
MSRDLIRSQNDNRDPLVKHFKRLFRIFWQAIGCLYFIILVTNPFWFWSTNELAALRMPPSAATTLILILSGILLVRLLDPKRMRAKCTLPVSRRAWAMRTWLLGLLLPFALLATVATLTLPPIAIWKSHSEYSSVEIAYCACAPGLWTQIWLLYLGMLKLNSALRAKSDPSLALLLLATPVAGALILTAIATPSLEAGKTPEPELLQIALVTYTLFALQGTYALRGHLIGPLIETGKTSFVIKDTDLMEFVLPAPFSTPPPLPKETPPEVTAKPDVPQQTSIMQLSIPWTLYARTLAESSVIAFFILFLILAIGFMDKFSGRESDSALAFGPNYFRALMVIEWFTLAKAIGSSSVHWSPLRTLPLTTQDLAFQLAAFVWVAIVPFCIASVVLILCSFRWEYMVPLFSLQVGSIGIAALIQGLSPRLFSGDVERRTRDLLCFVGCVTYVVVTVAALAQPAWTTSLLTSALGVLAGYVGLYVALPRAIANDSDVYKLNHGNRADAIWP